MNDRLTRPAAEVAAFFREVARDGVVWTLRDRGGMPAPLRPDHRRVQPFWSSRIRAIRLAATAEGFAGFEATMIPWHEFRDAWLPGLERDGLLVGVNWCGANAIGYDLEPSAVRERVERARTAKERQAASRQRGARARGTERTGAGSGARGGAAAKAAQSIGGTSGQDLESMGRRMIGGERREASG